MGEFTCRMAARRTRAAVANLENAYERLRACSRDWEDLDDFFRSTLVSIPDLPNEVERLRNDLDELYPTRPKRGKQR